MTSDLAELSNKKCNSVNNRCIRSKISGDNLDFLWVELGVDVTSTRSRLWYNPVRQEVQLVGVRVLEIRCQRENQLQTEGLRPSGPWLSSPGERERSAAIARRAEVNMLQFCSVSNSPLTRNPFATLSNKVWEVYFSKELCPFVIIVLTMFLHAYEYVTLPL